MRLYRTAERCAAFTIFTESRACFRGWFLHELRVRFGGWTNWWPIRGQNSGHSRASFRVLQWRTPVAKKRSARSKSFFFGLVEVNQRHLFKVYVFLSSRITASWRGGSKQSRRLKKRKPNNLRRYYRHSRFAHVLNVFFTFTHESLDFPGAEHSSFREQKEGWIRRRIFGSECKRKFLSRFRF